MDEPHRTASGVITDSPLVLVDAIIDGGIVGHGIVFTYTTAALGPVADFIRNLAPLVEGKPLAPSATFDQLTMRFRLLGTQGLVGQQNQAAQDANASRAGSAVATAGMLAHWGAGTWHRAVDRFIALSTFAKQKLIEGGLPESKILVKQNFVDPDPSMRTGRGGKAFHSGASAGGQRSASVEERAGVRKGRGGARWLRTSGFRR
jgi:hypothetical protein